MGTLSVRPDPLPAFDWTTGTRDEARYYLRNLLELSGHRHRRGKTRPTRAELASGIAAAVVEFNREPDPTPARVEGFRLLLRLSLCCFNQLWPPETLKL